MAKYSESQKKAIDKYRSGKFQLKITIEKEKAELYKSRADAAGKSLTKYITDILDKES